MSLRLTFVFWSSIALLILSGCPNKSDRYSLSDDENAENYTVVTMKAYDPASQEFTFRFDNTLWAIEEWTEDKAPNGVALIHQGYSDGSCYILPGTIGQGGEPGSQAYDGTLLTENYAARTVEVVNAAGIRTLYAVGYEVDEVAYIFEVNFPLKDQTDCEIDAQPVMTSFDIPGAESTTEEATTDEIPTEE